MRTSIRDVLPDQYKRTADRKEEAFQPFQAGTPLVYCIQQFGGVVNFAKAIGRSTRQIYRWRNEGGLISADAQTEAILAARRMGIDLDVSKLVYMPPVSPVSEYVETGTDESEVSHVDEPAGVSADS